MVAAFDDGIGDRGAEGAFDEGTELGIACVERVQLVDDAIVAGDEEIGICGDNGAVKRLN